eukprot:CAMPEP_0167745840 /NCGR_PEP_ID=MMETSP0110_2-20121227/3373_1 /TAXON_ID=629695 /ORGANISM="Gymnochlora sp., Strain CCMP2014" /LENGTH=243 /DNA_ID=CAMNT_0007630523 /DNA_START=157 /DNA_END=885 /DNA_ORIENTATION=-
MAYKALSLLARIWLWCFGIWWIEEKGQIPTNIPNKCLLISNHLGIHEILWFFFKYRPGFVAKAQVANVPVIGPLTSGLGSVFVKRKADFKEQNAIANSQSDAKGALAAIVEKFRSDRRVRLCIFPEGTTTNGEQIISFRSGAFRPMVPILPHVVQFTGWERGVDFDPHYSAIPVSRWALGVLASPTLCLRITYLPVQVPKDGETAYEFRDRVQSLICKAGDLPVVSSSYKDKRAIEDLVINGW